MRTCRSCLARAMAAAIALLQALHERNTVVQCSRLPTEKSPVCTGLCTHGETPSCLPHVRSYIPKRNKLRFLSHLTFLNMTFDIPKHNVHIHTYTYGENTSWIRLPRAKVLSNESNYPHKLTFICLAVFTSIHHIGELMYICMYSVRLRILQVCSFMLKYAGSCHNDSV